MGKTNGRGPPPEKREERQLTQRPMAAAFKGMRVGPECLECRGPIDSRPGYSVPNPRGSRKHQRHGFLHPDCQEKAEKRLAERTPGEKARLAVPCLSEEDIGQILDGGGEA